MHRFFRWRERLQAARDEREVRNVIAEYLLTLEPATIEALPAPCQRSLMSGDISDCAVALLQAEMAYGGPEETRQLLHEAAHTFAAASVRLAKLRMEPIVPSSE